MSKERKYHNNKQAEKSNSSSDKNLLLRKQEIHLGPIPSPDTLKQYNEIEPGFANRIIKMAENEQVSRLKNNTDIIKHTFKLQYFGLILGFILSVIALVFGFLLITNGKQGAGTFIALLGLSGIIRTFIHGSKPDSKKGKQ